MVEWSQLILPVLLSAVFVFVVSSVMHTVLKYHNGDMKKLANEDEVRAAVRKGDATAGMYFMPYCTDHKEMKSPEHAKKLQEGPVGLLVLRPSGTIQIGPFLLKWFVYTVIVSALAAYLARATLHHGDSYLQVFRVVGASAWLAYSWQSPSDSIWKGQPWPVTVKVLIDGLVYASVTAGTFGWLWPR